MIETSVTRPKLRPAVTRAAMALTLVLGLTACGNRPGIKDELTATGTFVSAVRGQIAKTRGTAERRDTSVITAGTPAQVREVMGQLNGDLISIIMLKTGESSILQDAGFNHGYRRWVSITGQTFTLKSGMLTSTRGMGFDLMSAEADPSIDLIRRQTTGNVNKVYRFLDGEDQETEVLAQCTVSPRGREAVTLPTGATVHAMNMRETCLMGRRTINNFFWVSGGRVVQSRQWASDEIGEVLLQSLRGA